MTAEIAHPSDLTDLPVNYGAVLGAIGLRANDPKAQAVVLVCQRYSLDPVLKHVVLVEGSVYITRDGLLHVAHESGQFDGMEVEEARLSEDGTEWRSRATVYRKDMSRGVAFSGRYPKGKKNAPEMAEKVAVARALRHAFDVSIGTEDERQAQQVTAEPVRRVTAAEITGRPEPQPEPEPAPAEEPTVVDGEPLWPDVAEPGAAS